MNDFKPLIRHHSGNAEIFDPVRRRYTAFTPEEYVRQWVIHYLITEKKVPKNCISVETSIKLNKLNRRVDLVVYTTQLQVAMIVECKSPDVILSQEVLDQILRYNTELGAPLVAITNGTSIQTCLVNSPMSQNQFIDDFPEFEFINSL